MSYSILFWPQRFFFILFFIFHCLFPQNTMLVAALLNTIKDIGQNIYYQMAEVSGTVFLQTFLFDV